MPAKPTAKQAKAMELIRTGKTPRSAMLAAGYSEDTAAHPTDNLLRTPAGKTIIEQHQAEYAALGIIPNYYVARVKDLIEANKIDHSHTEPDQIVPDWSARAKGLELYRKDIGLEQTATSLTQVNVEKGGTISVAWQAGELI